MFNFLLIAVGGAIGAVLRHSVSVMDYGFFKGSFPIGTLIVNIIGSFIIGFLFGIFERSTIPSHVRHFMFIGVLGGFTTFSSYSLDSFNMLRDGQFKIAAVNILSNNLLGIILVFTGFFAAKLLARIIN